MDLLLNSGDGTFLLSFVVLKEKVWRGGVLMIWGIDVRLFISFAFLFGYLSGHVIILYLLRLGFGGFGGSCTDCWGWESGGGGTKARIDRLDFQDH